MIYKGAELALSKNLNNASACTIQEMHFPPGLLHSLLYFCYCFDPFVFIHLSILAFVLHAQLLLVEALTRFTTSFLLFFFGVLFFVFIFSSFLVVFLFVFYRFFVLSLGKDSETIRKQKEVAATIAFVLFSLAFLYFPSASGKDSDTIRLLFAKLFFEQGDVEACQHQCVTLMVCAFVSFFSVCLVCFFFFVCFVLVFFLFLLFVLFSFFFYLQNESLARMSTSTTSNFLSFILFSLSFCFLLLSLFFFFYRSVLILPMKKLQ